MLFADFGEGHYGQIGISHNFSEGNNLGLTPLKSDTTILRSEPTRQLLPTQLEPMAPLPDSPIRTASLVTASDGTYDEDRVPYAVPVVQVPVKLPRPSAYPPLVPSQPSPIPGVIPEPTLPSSTAPGSGFAPAPGGGLIPAPSGSQIPDVTPPDGSGYTPPATQPSALLPQETKSNMKWFAIGGVAVVGILGALLIFR